MKRILCPILGLAAILVTAASCKEKFSTSGEVDNISTLVFTYETSGDDIGIDIATVFGQFADYYDYNDEVDEAGFYYGTDPKLQDGNVVKKHLDDWWGEGEDTSLWKGFKANIFPLTPNTTYYYRAYLLRGGEEQLGIILSFKTKPNPVTSVTVTPSTATIKLAAQDKTVQLSAEALPEQATDRSISWYSSNDAIASVDENGLVTGKSEGTAYIYAYSVQNSSVKGQCKVTVVPVPPTGALDMGLPSGTLWHEKDLESGSGVTGVGRYFAWAEKTPQNPPFDSEHYDYGDEYDIFSKYNNNDGYRYLLAEDDPARYYKGENWKVPSAADWAELFENCDITKSSSYFKLTAKNPGADGVKHTLYFPFGGYYQGSDLMYDDDSYGTEQCYYWQNEVTYYVSGWNIYKYALCTCVRATSSGNGAEHYTLRLVRWYGARVRAVYKVSQY